MKGDLKSPTLKKCAEKREETKIDKKHPKK